MANWRIYAHDNPDWQSHVADCDEEHAHSVLRAIQSDDACPNDLALERLDPEPQVDPEPEVQPEPEPEPEPAPRKRFRLWSK